jgi:hypothetical protein
MWPGTMQAPDRLASSSSRFSSLRVLYFATWFFVLIFFVSTANPISYMLKSSLREEGRKGERESVSNFEISNTDCTLKLKLKPLNRYARFALSS